MTAPPHPPESFRAYCRRAGLAAQAVFRQYPPHALDEQAGPAYLEGLALSRWIFWRRLAAVNRLLPHSGTACIDFGCGFGMMLPWLRRRFSVVCGVDLMPELARRFLTQWRELSGEALDDISIAASLEDVRRADASVDLILALDVLEHVGNLPELLAQMARLLAPDGRLLVTGPTENWLYKLGRRIVGFSGEYHVRHIGDIAAEMRHHFHVRIARRLYPPVPLFHVLTAQPRPAP